MPPRLILGSASQRRAEILQQIGMPPSLIKGADIDETPHKNEIPRLYALRVAAEKNAALARLFPDDYILTADTTCALGRRILNKPADRAEAERMLRLLSGRAHRIYTGVVVRAPSGRIAKRLSDNRLKIKHLGEDEIRLLLDSEEWVDKTAGIKIQGLFSRFIISINGTPSGIIGLPAYETAQMLAGLGYRP